MDRNRRDLIVEGARDRLFLEWLLRKRGILSATIIEISHINLPGVIHGGDKERILKFAEIVGNRTDRIRFFIDSDSDVAFGRPFPANVWTTDWNDVEGYLLDDHIIEKTLRLGLKSGKISSSTLLERGLEIARYIGALRALSKRTDLNLKINMTSISRFILKEKGSVIFNRDKYLRAVLQNTGTSMRTLIQIKKEVGAIYETMLGQPSRTVVRGKDVIEILERLIRLEGVRAAQYDSLLWCAFHESEVVNYPQLNRVLEYLAGA